MFKTVGTVMIIMIFSRLMALLGNQVYITFFGISLEMDIYSYATQLPNIIFNSFGTALSTIVIPIFAGHLSKNEKDRAFRFADNIISLSVLFTIALSAVAMFLAPVFIFFTRFRHEGYGFAIMALQIMFPIIIFYALNYIFQGILQSQGKFNMPAAVSIPSSLIIIGYVFLFGKKFGIKGLLVATFIGIAMQALILIPPILKTEYRFRIPLIFRYIGRGVGDEGYEDIKNALRLIPPVLLGTSAYQMNMLFNVSLSANFKDTVAIIAFVQNLVLYAVLALIYSITAVVFPKLSKLASTNDMDGFKSTLQNTLQTILYILFPISVGFIAVRYQLIDFIYGWGKINTQNVYTASAITALYAVGVWGLGIKEVTDRAFYSLKDTKKPAIVGVLIMIVNVFTSLILVKIIGVYGIPIAYSVSIITGAFMLIFMIKKKLGEFEVNGLIKNSCKIIFSSIFMYFSIVGAKALVEKYQFASVLLNKSIKLFVPVVIGTLAYLVITYLLKLPQFMGILKKIKKSS